MRAEGIVFHSAAPVVVHHHGPFLPGADSVHPVVFVGEAAAGPAEHGYLELSEGLQDVCAVSVNIWDIALRTHPDALVDASAKVLGELAVKFGGNGVLAGLELMEGHFNLCGSF